MVDVAKGHRRLRLDPASGLLERWGATAGQVDKNAVYSALFAVAEGSVSRAYEATGQDHRPSEFLVVVRTDLVIKVQLIAADLFDVTYIGPVDLLPQPS